MQQNAWSIKIEINLKQMMKNAQILQIEQSSQMMQNKQTL